MRLHDLVTVTSEVPFSYSPNINYVAVAFLKAFYTTIYREWTLIDRLRLDKFMMVSSVAAFIQDVHTCITIQYIMFIYNLYSYLGSISEEH